MNTEFTRHDVGSLHHAVGIWREQDQQDEIVSNAGNTWAFQGITPKERKDVDTWIFYVDHPDTGDTIAEFKNVKAAATFVHGTRMVIRPWTQTTEEAEEKDSIDRENFRQENRVFVHRDLSKMKEVRRTFKKHGQK